MSMIVCKGRPTDRRSNAEEKCYDLLDSLGIDYTRLDHPPVMTTQNCTAIDEALNISSCKNLFLRNEKKTRYYLLMMPGDKRLDSSYLTHEIGESRLSFGSEKAMDEMIGIATGSVSPLALMNDPDGKVHLLIDREVLESESIGFHPCINTSSLKISTRDFQQKLLPALRHEPKVVRLTWRSS